MAVDRLIEVKDLGPLARYRDVKGHVFSMSAERAKLLGLTPVEPAAPEADATESKARAPASNKAVRPASNKSS
jgi:hypothetical protein